MGKMALGDGGIYSYSESFSASTTGVKDTVKLKFEKKVSIQLVCTGGAAAVIESTMDPESEVDAGTASWELS